MELGRDMTKQVYDSLSDKEKAFIDAMILIYKEQQKTNQILEAILKNE